MKRVLTLSSVAVLLGATIILIYSSCNKKETNTSLTTKGRPSIGSMADIVPTDAGMLHNAAVNLTTSYWYPNFTTFTADSLMKLMLINLTANYPDYFSSVTVTDIENMEATSQFKTLMATKQDSGPALQADIYNELSYLKTNGNISATLYADLYGVFDLSNSYCHMDSMINAIDTGTLTATDQNNLGVVKSILESSHTLWSTWDTNHAPELHSKWNNGHEAIAMDAIWGLATWYSGPVSLLIGSLASIAWLD